MTQEQIYKDRLKAIGHPLGHTSATMTFYGMKIDDAIARLGQKFVDDGIEEFITALKERRKMWWALGIRVKEVL